MSDLSLVREKLFDLIKACIRIGKVVLSSGKETDFYFDGRTVTLHQEGVTLIASLLLEEIKNRPEIGAIGGPTSGADPIVSAVGVLAQQQNVPLGLFYIRKEAKGHGMQKQIEGPPIPPGTGVFLVDDVLTTGGSLIRALDVVTENTEAKVMGTFILVDRQEGGREKLEEAGLEVVSLFGKSDFSVLTKSP